MYNILSNTSRDIQEMLCKYKCTNLVCANFHLQRGLQTYIRALPTSENRLNALPLQEKLARLYECTCGFPELTNQMMIEDMNSKSINVHEIAQLVISNKTYNLSLVVYSTHGEGVHFKSYIRFEDTWYDYDSLSAPLAQPTSLPVEIRWVQTLVYTTGLDQAIIAATTVASHYC